MLNLDYHTYIFYFPFLNFLFCEYSFYMSLSRHEAGEPALIIVPHRRRRTLIEEDANLHWYKSHQNNLHGPIDGFHTEESENECMIEDKRYSSHCVDIMWNPRVQCYRQLKDIRGYRHYLQDILESVYSSIRWIHLPGGHHQAAQERNYLMNYMWIMSFITTEVDTTNKDSARHIRYRYEEVLFQAESLGITLQKFFQPLQKISQHHALVEEMAEIIHARKIDRPPVERKIFRLSDKPDSTLYAGNKIRDFSKLLIYVRKDTQVWTRFLTLSEADKVDIVSKGLMEISENLKELKGLLKRPLRALRAATSNNLLHFTCFLPTLVPHVNALKKAMRKIMIKHNHDRNFSHIEKDDKRILEAVLSETESHYEYVLRYGEVLVEEIWDIILMVRLSYNFIRESPQNNIMVASHEAVMISKFKPRKLKKLLKPSSYLLEDFFRVDCPDTLRKLPVIVSTLNTEISLQ